MMLRGPGISELTSLLTGDSRATKSGGVAPLTTDKSVIACRLLADQLLVLGGPSGQAKLERVIATPGKGLSFLSIEAISALAVFCLFGPHINELLRLLTTYDVTSMTPGSCAESEFGGVPSILVRLPTPMLSNMRILIGWDVAECIWERIWRIG